MYGLLEPQLLQTSLTLQASLTGRAPTTWSSFFLHGHLLLFCAPAGLVMCFRRLTPHVATGPLLLVLYGAPPPPSLAHLAR
jgi:hypothetical protein